MFTPPKKIWSGWSPRTDPTRKRGSGGADADVSKGKDVVFDESTPQNLVGRVEDNMGLNSKLLKLESEVRTTFLSLCVRVCVCEVLLAYLN